ncbi:MAG: DUF4976 domain-containing protein [Sphingomonadales bacterium]|nr:DUF4976 domain-containing protein [Sphingomonadales bacterium]MDE2569887.1 DUF4976 domain-containing protein [Sphingomonadales bacterium]
MRNEMVLNVDIAPTLPDWRKDWLYVCFEYSGYENVRPCRGVRTERWKFVHYFLAPAKFELYDLQNDPHEDRNLYGKPGYEEITEHLEQRLNELRKETNDHYV